MVTFLVSDLSALNQTQYTYSVGLVSLFVTLLIILILRSQEGASFRPYITNNVKLMGHFQFAESADSRLSFNPLHHLGDRHVVYLMLHAVVVLPHLILQLVSWLWRPETKECSYGGTGFAGPCSTLNSS